MTELTTTQKIHQMVKMQYDLSFTLAGDNWLLDPAVDTRSAMLQETNELIQSAGYMPWWSKGDSSYDPENCVTEIVDLFHFLMQGCMQQAAQGIDSELLQDRTTPVVVDLVAVRLAQALERLDSLGPRHLGLTDIHLIEYWLSTVLQGDAQLSLRDFWEMAQRFDVTLDKLYGRYFAKNLLNKFRRHANYKGDKTHLPPYQKLWDGEHEDNWHVLRYIEQTQSVENLNLAMCLIYQHYTGIEVDAAAKIEALDHPEVTDYIQMHLDAKEE